MKKKIIIGFVAVAAVAAGVLLLNHRERFKYAGTIEATEVTLSARITGVIKTVGADEGDTVKAGDVLVTLSTEDLDVSLEELGKEYARARELLAAGSLNRDAYEKIKFKFDAAAVRKSWATIRASAAGTVLDRYHEVGELVSPGAKLMTLADLETVWAYVYVPQPMLGRVALGMPVTADDPETPGTSYTGRIVKINNEAEFTPKNVQTRAERTRLVYGVKIQFANPGRHLKPGMVVEAQLPEQ